MSIKGSGEPTEWREIDRSEDGVGWIPHPDEAMQRACHAIKGDDGGVWLIDPIDVPGLDDLVEEFGDVAGVVILLDRHKRDSAKLANRHDVSVWIPSFMSGVEEDIGAPVERFGNSLDESGFTLHKLVDNSFWQEGALFNEETGVLIVPESVGNTDYFHTNERQLGVHPMLRLFPPTRLDYFDPSRIRVGHGSGVSEGAPTILDDALTGSRARTPRLYFKTFKDFVLG
ncbi:hypothetical protein [Halovenus sp. HT40]|uniref:hypothetical protein n=1 Tax=Halovenus sp. HT40 TaxID=3126691 RepID=UPI00300EA64A